MLWTLCECVYTVQIIEKQDGQFSNLMDMKS